MEKTIECPLSEIEPELRRLVEEKLQSGEEILSCFRVEYHMVWAQIITNLRVVSVKAIALRMNIFSTRPRIEMPRIDMLDLKDIVHLELTRSQEYDLITVRISAGDGRIMEMNFTLESAAQKFHKVLQSVLAAENKHSPQAAVADRLRELSELLEMKLISDEEYREKRSQILKEL